MGRAEKKKAKKSNDSSVTHNLSQTLDNTGIPGSTIYTPKSSSTKKGTKNSTAAKYCHLNGNPHCKTADEIAFNCKNIIAEHLDYDSYYIQFKAWYDVTRIPEVTRSDKQKACHVYTSDAADE